MVEFAKNVCSELEDCITKSRKYAASTKQREMMWGYFHQLRTEEKFLEKWQNFFTLTTSKKANFIIIQFLIDRIFKSLICIHFAMSSKIAISGSCNDVI